MPSLPYPNPSAELRLSIAPPRGQGRPVSQGIPFLGRLFLGTNASAANILQIGLDTGPSGTATVSYSSSRARVGQIAGFSITLSKPGLPDQQWVFGGMTLVFFRQRLFVFSSSLTIDGVSYVCSGVAGPVEPGFSSLLMVKQANATIGTLLFPISGTSGITFNPSGNRPAIVVTATASGIQWVFNNQTYTGFPTIFDIDTSPGVAAITGGYQGLSVGNPGDENDWEASERGPIEETAVETMYQEPAQLPFPWSQFRLLVSPTPSDQVSVSSGVNLWGTIAFASPNGVSTVTLQSNSGNFVTVPVTYGSTRPDYGIVGPFKAQVDGADWEFAGLTIFRWRDETYVVSYALTIAGQEYNLTALPMPAKPFAGTFAVIQGARDIGTLKIQNAKGGYFISTGSSAKIPVSAREELISWGSPPEIFSGFPFFLDVVISRKGVEPAIGFLGSTDQIFEGEDDWEASARGPEPFPKTKYL
jgi:hypothetical protein